MRRRSFYQQNPGHYYPPTINDLKKHIAFNEKHFGSADPRDYQELIDRYKYKAEKERAEKEYYYGHRFDD